MGLATRTLKLGLTLPILFALTAATPVFADSPAGTGGPGTIGNMLHGLNPMNWTMPQFNRPNFRSVLPGQEDKRRIVKKKDSLFDDVSKTASNSWQKTKTVLNPMNLAPSNLFGGGPAASRPAEPESPGFFSSIFQPASARQPSQPTTVTDFLSQQKPSP